MTREFFNANILGIKAMASLSGGLSELLLLRSNFVSIVLPATASLGDENLPPASRSTLRILQGNEASLLKIISDFAGVVRGRELRNAREAAVIASGV